MKPAIGLLMSVGLDPTETRIKAARGYFDNHLATREPLERLQVQAIALAGLADLFDFENRGGGLYWHARTFPQS